MWIITFLLYLLIAAACAYIAQALVPNTVPGGFLVNAIVGVIGAWIGSSLMGPAGPVLMGVPLLPAILGSALFVFLLSLIFGMRVRHL